MISQRVVADGSYEEMRKKAFATLLEVCGSIDIGAALPRPLVVGWLIRSRSWRAVMFQDIPVSVSAMLNKNMLVSRTAVGMFVERRRENRASMGWFENKWRKMMRRYEPVIVITPVFGHYGIRSIHVELLVDGKMVHSPENLLTKLFYGNDLRHIKEFLAKKMPGLVI